MCNKQGKLALGKKTTVENVTDHFTINFNNNGSDDDSGSGSDTTDWNHLSLFHYFTVQVRGVNVFGTQHSTELLHPHIISDDVSFLHIIPATQCVFSLTVLTPVLCPRGQEHQRSC